MRKLNKFKKLWGAYDKLGLQQVLLFKKVKPPLTMDDMMIPEENKQAYQDLQVKKIAILNEMGNIDL